MEWTLLPLYRGEGGLNTLEPLRIGVIGAGYWGRKVAREVDRVSKFNDSVRLHSITDNSPTILEQCQQEFGPLSYHLDYRNLLSDPELSAVHICTPNPTHFEVASSFLKAGKGVLVEKPLAASSKEAYDLIELATQKKQVLSAGHIHRFNNGLRELKRAISSGVLGQVYYLRFRWSGLMPPQQWRDVITDLAPHPFDISHYVLGLWPSKITCRARGYRTSTEEVAFINAEHHGTKVTTSIEVSWLDTEKSRELTVVGSEGTAKLDCLEQKAVLTKNGSTAQIPIDSSNTLREEILSFVNCNIRSRQNETYTNPADGVLGAQVVRLLEASKESLAQDRTVELYLPLAEEILAR
jgi:UDP-N-acetylglucosamine 3-dehydrogenase